MPFAAIDWVVLIGTLSIPLSIAILYYRRAGQNLTQYFLSGRDLPWWLSGTSMVATTFAADTPLVVTGMVAASGISGNWLWWNAGLGSMLTVFLFAHLWRRAGITTDAEFAELRYTGKPAVLLRGFRALYLGLPINCLIIGWVNLALAKVLSVTLGWERITAVLVGLTTTGIYASLSGLRGVVVGDLVQFTLAMIGTVALAYFALQIPTVGGLKGLTEQLPSTAFQFTPSFHSTSSDNTLVLSLSAFIAFLGFQWWASWYPGQEPGGGGYLAQRMMATKNEHHAQSATLWFALAHYCLRPWPWIIVALVSTLLYPHLSDQESGYALIMRDYLPSGWLGLLIGVFFAAYMSTVSTQLNWGTSYLVNDVYVRFLRPNAPQVELVRISRLITVVVMLISGAVTFFLENVRQAWEFVLESGAGVGLVLILRWYWWRINATSEIAALLAAGFGCLGIRLFSSIPFPDSLLYLVPCTTLVWLSATWLTPAEPMSHLIKFFRRVHPSGPGWEPIRLQLEEIPHCQGIGHLALNWLAGSVLLYSVLFGVGNLLFGSILRVLVSAILAGVSFSWLRFGPGEHWPRASRP